MKLFLVVLFFLAFFRAYTQSPWVRNPKEAYMQLSFNTIDNYTSLFQDSNKTQSLQRELSDNTFQLYAEYGLIDRLSLKASVPIKWQQSKGFVNNFTTSNLSSGSSLALGNIELGAKYNLIDKPLLISFNIDIILPVSHFQETTGISSGYNAFSFLPAISIGYGHSRFYLFTALGTAFRTNNYSGYLRWETEVGIRVYKNIYIAFHLIDINSYKNGSVALRANQVLTGFYVNDQEFFVGTLKAIIGFKKWGITVSSTSAGFSGNAVAKRQSQNIGIYYELK